MNKILIPILFFFTFLNFCAIAEGRRFRLNINATVSNGNDYQRVDNHEYKRFCVYMVCSIPDGNHVFGDIKVQNNVDKIINVPEECDLDDAITFFVTHLIRYRMRGQHCFADGGSHQQRNYNNWPQTRKRILNGRVDINYVTRHSLDEPTPTTTPNGTESDESESAGSVPTAEYNGSEYSGSD
uniref:Uncharacterized protein n=1 Tax=Meloidogyne enterolobii TaxID=390850 RepID=A0A6V7Y083_MELEN|nr:unnamed protein product [Meloidogyne enterolobii]